MQLGLEDCLEASVAIEFCVKLGKNARETSLLVKRDYGLTCTSQASVFGQLKKFNDSGEDEKRGKKGRL